MIDVGFVGLGSMGAAIAERIEGDDVRLHVHDRVASAVAPFVARGAQAHDGARSIADAATIVFACLPSPETSVATAREVAGGAAIATYVETSTIGRAAMAEVAALLDRPGIALVDAPVSGGPDGAREGRLAMLAAGAPAALAQVRPLLARIAGTLVVVGDAPGLGQMMKLVNNMVAASLAVVTLEAMAAGACAGLDAATMVAVLEASSGQSSATRLLLPRHVLTGSFDFGATIATMAKDVDLALGEAALLGAPMPVAEAVASRWREAREQLGGQADLTRIAQTIARAAGTSIAP